MIAHVSGLPVEELLPALMSGGAWLLVVMHARAGRRAGRATRPSERRPT